MPTPTWPMMESHMRLWNSGSCETSAIIVEVTGACEELTIRCCDSSLTSPVTGACEELTLTHWAAHSERKAVQALSRTERRFGDWNG